MARGSRKRRRLSNNKRNSKRKLNKKMKSRRLRIRGG